MTCKVGLFGDDFRVHGTDAIQELREKSEEIGRVITSMHPIVPKLGDITTQNEVIRALFELTKQVEVIKKHLLRLQKRDDSTAL